MKWGNHESSDSKGHPIERLMTDAQKRFDVLLETEANTVAEAAKNYRSRRGRHPPPGFDAWYRLARNRSVLVVEPFFDQIESDLAPLWGVDAHNLRRMAHGFSPKITIRNGTINAKKESSYTKLAQVASMLRSLAEQMDAILPDLDIPVNANNEPAMLVPWETIDTALQFVKPMITSQDDTIDDIAIINDEELAKSKFDPQWLDGRERHTSTKWFGPRPLWSLVRSACPPSSPARTHPLLQDIWHREGQANDVHTAAALLPSEPPSNTLEGYVKDWTTALEICQNPSWQGLHGAFVAPTQMSVTQKLFPLFSTSKMTVSNEILIPNVGDWNTSIQLSSKPVPWSERADKLHWRGPATGGKNTASNWQRFHRHRFVAMLNATHVEIAEALLHAGNESLVGLAYAKNFRLLPANQYNLATQRSANMAEWVNSWGDAVFTDLQCSESADNGTCSYTDDYFSVIFEAARSPRDSTSVYKYSAILDGEGVDESEAFSSSLGSGTFTLKASIYRQWYDSRIIPWLHFAPLDNTFVDLYPIMEFFRGSQIKGDNKDYAHAHIEIEKHEHHFKTPNSEEYKRDKRNGRGQAIEQDADGNDRLHGRSDGNDEKAQQIVQSGKEWAARALSKDDALVYVYRLLLEYARVKDDRREALGWTGDLYKKGDI